jgi:cyanophycinase
MISNVVDAKNRSCPELIDVRLHLLPNGSSYAVPDDADNERHGAAMPPNPLKDFIRIVTKRNPIS